MEGVEWAVAVFVAVVFALWFAWRVILDLANLFNAAARRDAVYQRDQELEACERAKAELKDGGR